MYIHLPVFLGVLLATFTFHSNAFTFDDWARVKSTEPIYGQATSITRQKCTKQWVQRSIQPAPVTANTGQDSANVGGAILGGLIGGVLGNQVGKGSGNTAATILGAGAGAVIGERMIGNTTQTAPATNIAHPVHGSTEMVEVETCVPVTEMQAAPIVGYRVVLDYQGRDIVYQTQIPPRTNKVRVRVQTQVTPLP